MNVTLVAIFQDHYFFLEGVAEGKTSTYAQHYALVQLQVLPRAEKRLLEDSRCNHET